jgi:hypothetical protein
MTINSNSFYTDDKQIHKRKKSLLDTLEGQNLILNENSHASAVGYSVNGTNCFDSMKNISGGNDGYKKNSNLPFEVSIMEVVLRFLQLLCENHNSNLQNYLRVQKNNKNSYNLVCETLQFLDSICGSTSGGLGLLGLWINEDNVHLINQTLQTLTEYCQGPCRENQYSIINHDSNGIDIVIALIMNDIPQLSNNNLKMYYDLKNNASKLLLSLLESNDDVNNAERIMINIKPNELINAIITAYELGKEMERQKACSPIETTNNDKTNSNNSSLSITNGLASLIQSNQIKDSNSPHSSPSSSSSKSVSSNNSISTQNYSNSSSLSSYSHSRTFSSTKVIDEELSLSEPLPLEVGHNLYILAHKLAKFNKDLYGLLKTKSTLKNEALRYYEAHTGQIEVNILFYKFFYKNN